MLPDGLRLNLIESFADVEEFFRWLGEYRDGPLFFDTETTGLSPERDHIRLIQFGDKYRGWAMSWEDYRGIAKEVLTNYEGELGAHNLKFDVRQYCNDIGMSVTQWPWHRSHDTQGMAHINDSQRSKALKALSDRLVDPRASQGQKALDEGMKANGWTWATVPITFPPYWQYGALDPVLAAWIYEELKKSTPQDLYDMEMGAIRVAAKMEERGARVSLAYSHDKSEELRAYANQARQYLKDAWNIENPTPIQLTRFFEREGVPLLQKYTGSGAQSMDKDVLAAVDHTVGTTVLAMKKAEKMAGTYLENFIRFADPEGYLHPGINTMAARTGRMSITEPALQTLPSHDPLVRNAFITRDGHSLLTIDADQIEARLTAHFSGDQGLIDAFMSPDDFFEVIASQIYNKPVKKGMRERDLTKNVTYGKIYGASVLKMAQTAGVPQQDMHIVNALFDARFPEVGHFMGKVIGEGKRRRMAEGRGYVITPYGRKLLADEGKEYTLVNYLIQCHASEILKKKMVDLDAVLPDEALMILPIHDEIVFDVPNYMVEEVRDLAVKTLNESEGYRVPISWGADLLPPGAAWGFKYTPQYKEFTAALAEGSIPNPWKAAA